MNTLLDVLAVIVVTFLALPIVFMLVFLVGGVISDAVSMRNHRPFNYPTTSDDLKES